MARTRNHSAEWQRRKANVYAVACLLRDSLRKRLGGKCSAKGCGSTVDLEFHHPHGRDWEPREKNLLQRMRLYWRDYLAGLLKLLCSTCNGRDGAYRGYWQRKKKKRKPVRKGRQRCR